MTELYDWVRLIPLFPFLAFAIILLFTQRNQKLSTYLAWAGIGITWLLGWTIVFRAIGDKHVLEEGFRAPIFSIPTGRGLLELGFQVDALTTAMLFMVPFVCLMIFIYSKGYMHGDPRYSRFFAYISLFATGMLGLIVSDNLLLLYIFWEVMGLCSYLLIGFWYEKPSAMKAGLKAFITTRIGDVIMFLGMLLLYSVTGTLSFHEIFSEETLHFLKETTVWLPLVGTVSVAPVIAVLLFGGAVGKSAQFPLHVWLPDAMEGPTPVSALIHAATMVSAGVYLVARMFPIFALLPETASMSVVAFIGGFTALLAATIALAQDDIKRVLAYSTISQLGYMIAALGVGAYVAATFHLITHAFFKALLFLGSGSVIHGAGTQDMMEMGGLRKKMPITFWTFVAGMLALAGVPPFAGFWSKDEILAHAFEEFMHKGVMSWPFFVWLVLSLGALLTAFYMARQVFLTFYGEPRSHHMHAHESPKVMTYPLIALAVFAVFLGFVGVPEEFPVLGPLFGHNLFHHIVGHQYPATPLNWGVMGLSVLLALTGLFLGWLVYGRNPLKEGQPDPMTKLGPVYTLLRNKYYIDEFYSKFIVRPAVALATLLFRFDNSWVIDPFVNLVGKIGVWLSDLGRIFDLNIIDGIVNGVAAVTAWFGKILRLTQTGKAQNYLLVAILTVLLLLGLYLYLPM
ncbi:MAG: NADH-quinone oxidoreductase subunit L [Anaerolineae bacterium]|nr:NADH-quinone oxidoreductase subunit L [Anaerolineae bacterium]